MDIDLPATSHSARDSDGEPVSPQRHLAQLGGDQADAVAEAVRADMFTKSYADVFTGDERWKLLEIPEGDRYTWTGLDLRPQAALLRGDGAPSRRQSSRSRAARALAVLGDCVTTDHISPAGAIKKDSPAGSWLIDQGVERP